MQYKRRRLSALENSNTFRHGTSDRMLLNYGVCMRTVCIAKLYVVVSDERQRLAAGASVDDHLSRSSPGHEIAD